MIRARVGKGTLVINSTNFNNKSWFDIVGRLHSDAMRVEERLTLVSADNIDYRVTIDDPKVYTRPWTMSGVAAADQGGFSPRDR